MIITISRQFGSGGSEIGRKVADQLGIPYYDKNIIDHVADKLGFSPQYVQQVEEKPTGSFLFSMAMYSYATAVTDGLVPAELRVTAAQTEFILEKASEGPGVFVGRCSDYILKERRDVLNVFVYADMAVRIEAVKERYNLSEKEALRNIQQTDKRRALYYNTNTQHRWGAKESYHLMIDCGTFGVDGAVAAIEYCGKLLEKQRAK
ncbi:MAG: cytidylate kinase-like family protein [Oscillospiraceae bacterium]|nr:cytidylate kinase-like family protein [Oscillospiraceae bacterium]